MIDVDPVTEKPMPEDGKELLELMDDIDNTVEGEPEFFKYDEDAPNLVEEARKHKGRPTGFDTLDALTGGVSSGELIVITAKTGVGKSTLAQSIGWQLAKADHPILFYTLEVSLFNFIQPFIDNDEEASFDEAGKLQKVSHLPIYFPKNLEKLDFKKLKRAIQYAKDKFGVEHVFIDHLSYLISTKDLSRNGSMSLHIGDKLRELRRIALQTGVSIFLVAHVTKIEDGKRPTIADLRDSSFVGQEADVVVVLWREKLDVPQIRKIDGVEYEDVYSPVTHCAVEKSRRTGRRGVFWLRWNNGLYEEMTAQEKRTLDLVELLKEGDETKKSQGGKKK